MPALQLADARLIFRQKKSVLFLFKCLWQRLGVGGNLGLSKQGQKMYDFS